MKKLSILFLSLVALTATVTSCTKDKATTTAATALELTVKDDAGTIVAGATVNLFASLADLNSGDATKIVATGTSDSSGKVTFNKNLQTIVYYFDASKDCNTNLLTDTYMTAAALVSNTTTKMDASIAPTATLTLTNGSTTDSYNIYVGTQKLNSQALSPSYTQPLPIPAGQDFAFKAVKLASDGVTETTDVVTKTINIACGGSDTFTFPQP